MTGNKKINEIKKRFGELVFISILVGIKLVLSYFIPGLKTPNELVWTGGILLFFSIRSLFAYRKINSLS